MNTGDALELWFDFASSYSYPAAMRIEDLATARGVAVHWRPFLLGPIFREQGWNDSPFNLFPAKGHYMWRDLERICAALALSLTRPSAFPRNGLKAARIAIAARGAGWIPEFTRRVFTANFAADRDIAEPAVLQSCLAGLVDDPAATVATADDPEVKARLREDTERAAAVGIFGAPSFVVGDELFWGNDRLETALAWCLDGGGTRVPVT